MRPAARFFDPREDDRVLVPVGVTFAEERRRRISTLGMVILASIDARWYRSPPTLEVAAPGANTGPPWASEQKPQNICASLRSASSAEFYSSLRVRVRTLVYVPLLRSLPRQAPHALSRLSYSRGHKRDKLHAQPHSENPCGSKRRAPGAQRRSKGSISAQHEADP